MELIIKPTAKCNFSCEFCSAAKLDIVNDPKVIPSKIIDTINVLNPDGIIVTGGDPLCCDPEYYKQLLSICNCDIIFTTNLKDFYLHPDKWVDLFKNKRIKIGTSFNYGNTRRWDANTVYDETKFREVISLFKKHIGYAPPFIAVINDDNEDTYLQHVMLAKELGTYCRLNNALKMGRQTSHYPRYKVFKMWINIVKLGLENYEQNCFERSVGKCPINSSGMCQSTLRTVYIDHNGVMHYSNCEDKLNRDDGSEIPIDTKRPDPIMHSADYSEVISSKCLSCDLFNICNGCMTNREAAKQDPNYCSEMTKLKKDIIELGWKL